jgi:transcriptional regulator with XRE-family HTH domain
MERTPGGFGSRLREARERKGVSLRQIANATKISVSALEALERNDISRLPGGIFSRAFVRSYAVEVGLEPEETIRDFMAQFPNDSVTAGHPASSHVEDSEALESDRRMAATFLRLLAISVPLAAVVLYFGMSGTRAPVDAVAQPAVRGDVPIAARPIEVPQAIVPAVAQAADALTVGLSAAGPCWVSAIVDGQRVFERELQAGERQSFEVRREIVLTAGDAGALQLTLNGAVAKPLGRSGQVVTARVNMSNFKDHLAAQ